MGAAAVAATVLPATPAAPTARAAGRPWPKAAQSAADALRPTIRPRTDWAGELGVKGELVAEDNVRFLLVHHTASTNDYQPDDVAGRIRGFYEFHTGPEKGWPDVAYNFFVDRYGGIWEGRQGSVDGPVRGDATGGSQGFALLCALIGNHLEAPVTPEAQTSLVQLLGWLGQSYAVDTTPGATVSFVSRGSSRWPEGTEVTARTISGHRDMSTTTCPGDFAYPLLAEQIPAQVSALRPAPASTDTAAVSSSTSTSTAPSASGTAASDPVTSSLESAEADSQTPSDAPAISLEEGGDEDVSGLLIVVGGALGVLAAAGGAVSKLWRRGQSAG